MLKNLNNKNQIILSFPNSGSLDSLMLKILYLPKLIIRKIFNKNTKQPPRKMFVMNEILSYSKNTKNIKIKIVNYNTNIFTYPFTFLHVSQILFVTI